VEAVEVRVLILESASQLTISSSGPFELLGSNGAGFLGQYLPYERVLISSKSGGWKMGDEEYYGNSLRVETLPSFFVQVNDHTYRGKLEIHKERGKGLQAVNVLNLEDYLRGVIKQEISTKWPMEALKVQAVVARTFALRQALDNPQQIFHLKSTTDSQMYGGADGEDLRSDLAVRATADEVLTQNGKAIPTFYHAACGGHTEDAADLWSFNHSALRGVPCSYCPFYPVYLWQASIRGEEIRRALARWGYQIGEVEAIVPLQRSKTHRILSLEIQHTLGRTAMEGKRFRQCIGYDLIRSTNFTVKRENGGFAFQGKGWGHGVGLCQWGAKGMADRAFTYEEILEYYYPGTHLSRIEEIEEIQD
jgi:stage II sporulation protein D